MGDECVSVVKTGGTKKMLLKSLPFIVIGFGALIPIALIIFLIRWVNAPEIYPLLQCQDRLNKSSAVNFPSCVLCDFECIVGTSRIFITVPARAVTVRKRTDGQKMTTVVFSDVDCISHDWGDSVCARLCEVGRHNGESAEVLVPEDEDVKIWEEYLALQSAKESAANVPFEPGRVLPPDPAVTKTSPESPSAESPINK